MSFASLALSAPLLSVLEEIGLSSPTSVQRAAIPLLLAGRDLLALSQTGSGKTAAFALPILDRLDLMQKTPQALILCPTRELAEQVVREFRRLGRRLPSLTVLALVGGTPLRFQAQALARGGHVLVVTPGRVLDLLERGMIDTTRIRTVVLDEADRMLDMGFRDAVRGIFAHLPGVQQTALFSATFPAEVEALAKDVLRAPERITVMANAPPSEITHLFVEVGDDGKIAALHQALQMRKPRSAVVFCNRKVTASEVARALSRLDASVGVLHGDLEQRERDLILARFRNESIRVLVATDVAARGLDVDSIELVCHYDVAMTTDDYIHRCGRTGRAGREGIALTLLTSRERERFERLLDEAGASFMQLPLQQSFEPTSLGAPMRTLTIYAGRKSKLRPGDVLGALTGDSGGFDRSVVGKIEIHDRHAWVAIKSEVVTQALEALRRHGIKGRQVRVEIS